MERSEVKKSRKGIIILIILLLFIILALLLYIFSGMNWITGRNTSADISTNTLEDTVAGTPASAPASNLTSATVGAPASASANISASTQVNSGSLPENSGGQQSVKEVPDLSYLISAGLHTSFAIKNGTLYAWGEDYCGQLGNGPDDGKPVKTPAAVMKDVKTVSAGNNFVMVLKNDGTLWASGEDSNGQLGDKKAEPDASRSISSQSFVQVLSDVKAIDASTSMAEGGHTLAVKNDGSLWAWGRNDFGQVGNGATGINNNVNSPFRVEGMDNVTAVAAGACHSLALKADGSVWAWGRNDKGQVGNNSFDTQPKPVKILDDARAIAAGGYSSAATKKDGTVFVWGTNLGGLLGQVDGGTRESSPIPLIVPKLTDIKMITVGYEEMFAIKNDGTLYGWGYNSTGQLPGKTENTYADSPVKFMTGTPMSAVVAGIGSSIALTSEGDMWIWGQTFAGDDTDEAYYTAMPIKFAELQNLLKQP